MIPSLSLLFFLDHRIITLSPKSYLTIKIIGHQWYWDYNYNNFLNLNSISLLADDLNDGFSSYMTSTEDLYQGELRLLQVDNVLVLPKFKMIRFLITSNDVIHS